MFMLIVIGVYFPKKLLMVLHQFQKPVDTIARSRFLAVVPLGPFNACMQTKETQTTSSLGE